MRIRSRTLLIVFSETLRQGVTVGLAIVLVRLMSQEMYGTYKQVELVAGFLIGLLSLNLPASLYYFIPKLGEARRRALMNQTLFLSLAVGGVAIGLIMLGAGFVARAWENPALETPLRIYSMRAFAFLAILMIPPFFISIDRPVRSGVYSIMLVLLRAGPPIVLAALGYSLTTIFAAIVVSVSIGAAIAFVDVYRFCPGRGFKLDFSLIREQFGYVLPLQAATMVGMMRLQLDKLMIAQFFSPARYAVYVNGAIELPLVGIITSSVANAVMPNLVTLGAENKRTQALSLWHEGTRKVSLVIYPCFALCLISAHDLIRLAYPPEYADAVWPFMIYLGTLPVRVAVYGAVLRAFGHTRPVAVSATLSLVVHLGLSLALLWLGYGTMLAFVAPAIGTVVATYFSAAYMLLRIRQLGGVSYRRVMRWRELAWIMALCLMAGMIAWLVPLGDWPVAIRLLVRSLVYAIALLVILLMTRSLKDDEMRYLQLPFRWAGLIKA